MQVIIFIYFEVFIKWWEYGNDYVFVGGATDNIYTESNYILIDSYEEWAFGDFYMEFEWKQQ